MHIQNTVIMTNNMTLNLFIWNQINQLIFTKLTKKVSKNTTLPGAALLVILRCKKSKALCFDMTQTQSKYPGKPRIGPWKLITPPAVYL